MSAAIPLPYIQNTPAWEDARRDSIGSSDIPVITGSSPYAGSSPYDLWAFKTRRIEALPIDDSTQELFDLGHALEPVIAERYTLATGRKLRRVRRMLRHPDIEWATASLDRVSATKGERRVVELKWDPWARFNRAVEGVPPHVLEQVQWQLLVSGYEAADVAVLLGSHVEYLEVQPDRAFQDNLLFLAETFRNDHLLTDTPPRIDGSEATRKAIARLYPHDDGTLMEKPTAELVALMQQLRDAIPAEKAATEEVGRLKNAIRSALGAHSGVETQDWRISLKQSKPRRSVDWRAVAAALREIARDWDVADSVLDTVEQAHTTESEGARPLLTRWAKEEGQGWT